MRFLLALLLAPLLLAPVRLKDSTPGFFQPPAQSPAPESYSLPAAEALITPTVINVSPTLAESPTQPAVSSSLNLPLSPSPTAPKQVKLITISQPDVMSPVASALCQRGMVLVQDLSMLSYRAKPNEKLMTLGLATAAVARRAATRQWPDLSAYDFAAGNLPWFQPQTDELKQAIPTARRLCAHSKALSSSAANPEPTPNRDPTLGF